MHRSEASELLSVNLNKAKQMSAGLVKYLACR